jgi:subtilisin family serine protease
VTRAALAALLFALVCAPAAQAWDLPLQLPGDATASSVRADPDTWIVGAKPGRASAAIAARFSTRHFGLPQTGGYTVARSQARAFAAALRRRHLLVYAQANVYRKALAIPNDPLSAPPNDWRAQVVSSAPDPPLVTPQSPLIALVDAAADPTHPEWTGDPNFTTIPGTPVTSPHGTATAAVAAAPQNNIGILGVWPGARTLNVPLKTVPGTDGEISCDASGDAIARAVESGASVINMSYGSPSRCAAEWVQIYFAVAKGIIPVAAAGNEFESGNPLEFPASLPHVVTVAAVGPDMRASYFSSTNAAVDIAAPGQSILTAVPAGFDPEPPADGYAHLDGTSFAAPMVSAAAAWVRAARPDLRRDQVAQVLHQGAQDLERPGWDPGTGWGLVSVGGALRAKTPPDDPLEPNDDIVWIDGRAFGHADPPIYRGTGTRRVLAELDAYEDPDDVYRVVVPAHRKARISIKPVFGDPDLSVYNRAARAVADRRDLVSASHHSGHKGDGVTVFNRARTKRTYYVRVFVHRGSPRLDSAYVMRVARVR